MTFQRFLPGFLPLLLGTALHAGTSSGGRQLFIMVDMEGASEITEQDSDRIIHGSREWREFGRDIITSDVKAVCDAANAFGIDDILIYDIHFAGQGEPNINLRMLPKNVRLADVPDRQMDMRRIRGQVQTEPFGMVFVGQHARTGSENSYFPHSIQPKWKALRVDEFSISEMGYTAFNFPDVRLLAIVGDAAAVAEGKELYPLTSSIVVKDKAKNWVPLRKETYKIIRDGVLFALKNRDKMQCLFDTVLSRKRNAFDFSLTLADGYSFEVPTRFPWKGEFKRNSATWQAPSPEIGLELLWSVNAYAVEDGNAQQERR